LRCHPLYRERLGLAWDHAENHYTLPNKLKILVGFYMIATKIEDVYQVFLPPDVRAVLQQLRVVISLGLEGVPLACVGADGFKKRLLFWMLCPLALVLLAIIVVSGNMCRSARYVSAAVLVDLGKQVLPIVLRIAFLVYPCACSLCPTAQKHCST
jgi:hypothetical protein